MHFLTKNARDASDAGNSRDVPDSLADSMRGSRTRTSGNSIGACQTCVINRDKGECGNYTSGLFHAGSQKGSQLWQGKCNDLQPVRNTYSLGRGRKRASILQSQNMSLCKIVLPAAVLARLLASIDRRIVIGNSTLDLLAQAPSRPWTVDFLPAHYRLNRSLCLQHLFTLWEEAETIETVGIR